LKEDLDELATEETTQFVSNQTRNLSETSYWDTYHQMARDRAYELAHKRKPKAISNKCKRKGGRHRNGQVIKMKDGKCMLWKGKIRGKGEWTVMFKWAVLKKYMGLCVTLKLCYNLVATFRVPPPILVEACVGGEINVNLWPTCPLTPINMYGIAWFSLTIGLRLDLGWPFGCLTISFFSIKLSLSAGIDWFTEEHHCWWVCGEGRRRRRWWTGRRRNQRHCHYKRSCDIYIKGTLVIQRTFAKITTTLTYWVRAKTLVAHMYLHGWVIKWWEAYSQEVYRRTFDGNEYTQYKCANEGEICECDGLARYGGRYASGRPGHGEETDFNHPSHWPHRADKWFRPPNNRFVCGVAAFGFDPKPGYHKHCLCSGL